MLNVNAWNKENTDSYIKEIQENSLDNGKNFIIGHLLNIEGKVIEYPCGLGIKNFITNEYSGMDFRKHFVRYVKDKENEKSEVGSELPNDKFRMVDLHGLKKPVIGSALVCVNYLQLENNPVEFINSMLTSFDVKNVFISFPYSPENGKDLETPSKLRGVGGGQFINNMYSEDAIREIAKLVNLDCNFIKSENESFAILYKIQPKEVKVDKSIEENSENDSEKITENEETIDSTVDDKPKKAKEKVRK